MAALQHHLLLVGGADLLNQMLGRVIGHDVIVLGHRMQDRHLDVCYVCRASTDRHGAVEQLVVPHQVLGDGAEILAGQRQRIGRPAIEHPIGFDELVVPDVLPQLHLAHRARGRP